MSDISKQAIQLVQPKVADSDANNHPTELIPNEPLTEKQNQSKVSEAQVVETADRLNQVSQSIERDLKFTIDEMSGDTIITVLDKKTNEVIRQIPSEEVLAIRENIESLKGILFSAEV